MRTALIMFLASLLLVGCGAPAAAPTSAPAAAPSAPTTAPLATLGATPPAVPTTQPSNTPQPAPPPTSLPAPAAARLSAGAVGAAFKAAGLEFEQVTPLTRAEYKFAPYLCTTALHFIVPSICVDCGGRVFECPNQADRDLLAKYFVDLGRSSASLYSWVYVRDNILVQINGDLPESKARQYEAALNSIK